MRMAIDKLKNDLVVMGEMCESALDSSIMALLDRDADLAYYVIDYDKQIDEFELVLDRQCMDLMQSGEVSGKDLRFVASATKIINDLERVGDLAVDIARHVLFLLLEKSILPEIVDFFEMANQVAQMMRESIQALLERDSTLAWKIIDEMAIIDDEMQVIFRQLLEVMRKHDQTIERCCHILFICQFLGRVAEKSTNIAEEVIYMTEAVTVRHRQNEVRPFAHIPVNGEAALALSEFESEVIREQPKDTLRATTIQRKAEAGLLSEDEIRAGAETGQSKAKEARKKLLKLRAAKQG